MNTDSEHKWARYLQRSPDEMALTAEMRSRMAEILEPYATGAKSLLVAHGAAIFACLQFLSSDTDQAIRTNVAFYAGVFCIGFCLAAVGTFAGLYAKQYALSYSWERNKSNGIPELVACGLFLGGSFLVLLFSVGAVGVALIKGNLGG